MIDWSTLDRMERYGGSFARQLARLYRIADPINQAKLEKCFKEVFEKYSKERW